MKKLFFSLFVVFFVACATPSPQTQIEKKTTFPVFELPIPQNDAEANYWEYQVPESLRLRKLKARWLLLKCSAGLPPTAGLLASWVNEVYEEIQARPDLKEKIKIIGIMQNNSIDEVDSFPGEV